MFTTKKTGCSHGKLRWKITWPRSGTLADSWRWDLDYPGCQEGVRRESWNIKQNINENISHWKRKWTNEQHIKQRFSQSTSQNIRRSISKHLKHSHCPSHEAPWVVTEESSDRQNHPRGGAMDGSRRVCEGGAVLGLLR